MAKKPPTKTRWSPLDHAGAIYLLDQLTQALLKGLPSTDPSKPPMVTADIPVSAANYLVHAIRQIKSGVTADDALMLTSKTGRPTKKYRDALLAMRVKERRKTGMSLEEAIAEAGSSDFISDSAAKDAYRNGAGHAAFVDELRSVAGDDVANDFIQHIKTKSSSGKN